MIYLIIVTDYFWNDHIYNEYTQEGYESKLQDLVNTNLRSPWIHTIKTYIAVENDCMFFNNMTPENAIANIRENMENPANEDN